MPTSSKVYTRGTHRVMSPAQTIAKARRFMGEMGITRVANITGLDVIGIPVVNVFRPNARSLAVSQGKGLTVENAQASGLMESIELHHAERIQRPLTLATLREVSEHSATVAVERLPRVTLTAFHADRKILWIEGLDLTSQERKLVPYEMVHTNYTLPLPTGSGCFVMSSNGLASGNDLTEATLHALCELIERDATTLWMFDSLERQEERRVDPNSVDDAECKALLAAYAQADVAVGIWETTTDVGVPCFACVIADRARSKLRLLYPTHGMGCHPVREVALSRALTEAAQSRLTFIAGSRDDSGIEKYRQAQDETVWEVVQQRLEGSTPRRFDQAPTFGGTTVEADQEAVLECLRRVGLGEAVVVDLTQPRFEIPVVRVIVPGLEPLYEVQGYTPGPRAQRVLGARFAGSA